MDQPIDVTDLFDAFHRVASCLFTEFGRDLSEHDDDEGVGFDDLMDQLELDVFLPACARRIRSQRGGSVDPDDVASRLRLLDDNGNPLEGARGRYHSHAFHPESLEDDVPNAVLAADLMPVERTAVRIVALPQAAQRGGARPRRDLPVT